MDLNTRMIVAERDALARECERLLLSRDSLQALVDHLRNELRDVVVVDLRDFECELDPRDAESLRPKAEASLS